MVAKIIISGGTGTIGTSFVRSFVNIYDVVVLGHSEKRQREFLVEFPHVPTFLCDIEDRTSVFSIFDKVRPDIVVHAAAVKHIDFADKQPVMASSVNVVGSLNIIAASQYYHVPITVGISTDKASDPKSVYGYTKLLMEKCFLGENAPTTKFAICRFGNVVGSAGSVIPIWKSQVAQGRSINITDERMKRFMFSSKEAVDLIQRAILMCRCGDGGFILTKPMKVVAVLELAKCISPNIITIGIRPGERLDECLFNEEEARYAEMVDGYVYIGRKRANVFQGAYTTHTAEYMSEAELRALAAS